MESSILTKFLPNKKEEKDFFLALEICPERIKAAACRIDNQEVEVLSSAQVNFSGSWQEATIAADEAISQVEEKFPPETEVNKVVLGLPTGYTKDGQIAEDKLANIKELLKKLSLTPLGFVEIPLAIINFLQKQGGGPETLILVRVGQQLTVSLVRIGKISHSVEVPKTENVAQDLQKVLSGFTDVEVLPSKILLFDGDDIEKAQQDMMNYPWLAQASFLHFPKIEVAAADLDIKSVAFAGASEIAQVVEIAGGQPAAETKEESANFGFVKDGDVVEQPAAEAQPEQPISVRPESAETEEPKAKLPRVNLSFLKLPQLAVLRRVTAFLASKLPRHLPFSNKVGLAGVAAVVLLLILGGAYAVAAWYWPTAQVDLMLKTQTLQQQMEIILNPKASAVNEETKEIPALAVEIEEKETKKAATTGKKTVGDPAKGEVTIYNKTGNSKTFKQGTIIVSPNNLKFTLDSETTVASASESIGSLTFGKQNAKVTASAIGPEGNLGVGQEFHFADFPTSSYSARNDVAFSGGTSREISVVAREDQENLLEAATKELTEKAKQDLAGKIGQGEKIMEETISGSVTGKNFDKEIDEEASELSLDLTMQFNVLGLKEADLLSILEKTISGQVPAGYEFKKEAVTTEVGELQKKKDGSQVLKVNFAVSLVPLINQDEIRKNLTGKSTAEADAYLRGLGNIDGYNIKFGRQLPFGGSALPRLDKNLFISTAIR